MAAALLGVTFAWAQPGPASFAIAEYFPSAVGDRWQFKNLAPDGLSPIITRVSKTASFRGVPVVQRDENNGDYRYQSVTADGGMVVHHLAFVGDRTIDYDAPCQLTPGRVSIGGRYHCATRYTARTKGVAGETGRQTYEVRIEGIDAVGTLLGSPRETLKMRTIALRTDDTGAQKGYELVEWLAVGVGAVKVQGDIYWNDAAGARLRTFKVDAVLEGAVVGDKYMGAIQSPDEVRAVADRAFAAFRVGLASGQWQSWFDMLTDDFSFYFPQGKWLGQHAGKTKAIEFFTYVSAVFKDGLRVVSVDRVLQNASTVLFEFKDEGPLYLPDGKRDYKNRVAISLDVRGQQIAGYREYFGSDGTRY